MLVQLRDQAGIGFIKLQKCLAPSDLLRGDGLARETHSPVSRYVAADGEGDVRLACLLACLRNIFSTICPPFIYSGSRFAPSSVVTSSPVALFLTGSCDCTDLLWPRLQ